MKYLKWKVLTIFCIYIIVSIILYLPNLHQASPLIFITQDSSASERIHLSTTYDYNTNTVLLTRIFHNKPFDSLQTFFISIARSFDFDFLFSLPTASSMYENTSTINFLYPIEIIPFFLSLIYIIRHWDNKKARFMLLLIGFVVAIIIDGLFLPYLSLIKLLPLAISIRSMYFIALFDWLERKQWLKKLYL